MKPAGFVICKKNKGKHGTAVAGSMIRMRQKLLRVIPHVAAMNGLSPPPGRHLWLFWREKNIKFYFRTKRRTRKNSSVS